MHCFNNPARNLELSAISTAFLFILSPVLVPDCVQMNFVNLLSHKTLTCEQSISVKGESVCPHIMNNLVYLGTLFLAASHKNIYSVAIQLNL